MEYVLSRLTSYADEALGGLHHLPRMPAKTALMDMPQWIVREATQGVAISDGELEVEDSGLGVHAQSFIRHPQR
jgi:hypothetical protein